LIQIAAGTGIGAREMDKDLDKGPIIKAKSIKNVFERYEVGNGLSLENFQAMELKLGF
jgi:hypothetical protein